MMQGESHLQDLDQLEDMYLTARAEKQLSMWYPYLLERDKLFSFLFSSEPNKQYDKALTLQKRAFQPTKSPQEDWSAFVNDVWKHLAPFRSQGIAPVQYELMLEPHFTEHEWARIYGDIAQFYVKPERRRYLCSRLLRQYTIHCYPLEARIRDFARDDLAEDIEVYATSRKKFETLMLDLLAFNVYCHYYRLLDIVKRWTPEERKEFFTRKDYLNEFGAPNYKRITEQTVTEAVNFLVKIAIDRTFLRKRHRDPTSESTDRRPKHGKASPHRTELTTPSQAPLCRTKKYVTYFKSYGKWVSSRALRDLMNSHWNSEAEPRNFQPFKLPYEGRPLRPTTQEREHRTNKKLCYDCGNHKKDDGKACSWHPLYDDVRRDNGTIPGVDPRSLADSKKASALTSYALEHPIPDSEREVPPLSQRDTRVLPYLAEEIIVECRCCGPSADNYYAQRRRGLKGVLGRDLG